MTPVWITTLVRGADRALIAIASVGLMAMMLHISIDILSSLFLNAPIAITSAIVTNYYMISVAFLPLFAAEFRDAHIGVNLLTAALPERLRKGLEIVVMGATAGVYFLLAAQTWGQAMHKLSTNAYVVEQTSKIIIWPSYYMLPIAFATTAGLLLLKAGARLFAGAAPGAEFAGKEHDHV